MTHSDADVLAMLALGDPDVDDADIGHVATCPECRAELERLTRVTRAARENGPVDFELQEPSPRVWESIRDQLTATPPAVSEAAPAAVPAAALTELPVRTPARARRRWPVLAAAAAALVILAGIALVVSFRPGGPEVQAQATLSGLPAWSTSNGQATMERESDGTTVLAVQLDSPAVHSGTSDYREVWLMSSDLTKAISVGLLDGGTGRFTMPPNIAAADYPVIDISQQPLNGDPAHSGDSIVRGTLSATR
ncbi:anti-sigma factor [Leifsonia sp. fls2-241-R2A-40a]|uniref:anti-sigma factor n=1 Tax=Leifsonia sp. fls2-241-R2A-40a TaxID=3040290 RepID=UPI002550ED6F|nr:anti-sigma factor [Leifsonia sp. fls2-241-R2A-40a]